MGIFTISDNEIAISAQDVLLSGHEPAYTASGFLHAIGSTLPDDGDIVPLKPVAFRSYRTKLSANISRYTSLGLKLVPVLSDDYGYYHSVFPGDDPGFTLAAWESYVGTYCNNLVSGGIDPWCIDIWNEPDLAQFWPRDFSQFCDVWITAAVKIKSLHPTWAVCGPSLANYSASLLGQFYAACQVAGIYPDYISFHQLARPSDALFQPWEFQTTLASTNAIAASYDAPIAPFFLGEYVGPDLEIVRPATAAAWMVALDIAGSAAVPAACHSVFTEKDYDDPLLNTGDNISNVNRDTLCGLLDGHQNRRAKWYLYRDYASMTGKMASDPAGVLVSADASSKSIRIIYCTRGSTYTKGVITVNGMADAYGAGRVMYQVRKYQDSAWSPSENVSITEYGSVTSATNSISIRVPPFAENTEAIGIVLSVRGE